MVWPVRSAINFTVIKSQIRFAKTSTKNDPECLSCCKVEETIDLHGVPPMSYSPGDRIVGYLDALGWVVIRGI